MSLQMFRILRHETAAELLKAWRLPSFVLPTLLFPTGFYLLFGVVVPAPGGRADAALFYLSSYGIFAAMGPALFGFGVGIAAERVEGSLALKRVAPVPVGLFLIAKMVMAAVFTMGVLAVLYAMAAGLGGARLGRVEWLGLAAVHLLTVPPFALLGLSLGLMARPQAAAGLANVALLGMAALGGLFLPLAMLPATMRTVAVLLPTYHLSQLALSAVGMANASPLLHLSVVAGFTALFAATACLAWRQDVSRS